MSSRGIARGVWLLVAIAMSVATPSASRSDDKAAREATSAFVPPPGKVLLIIGQDADSVAEYVAKCAHCPPPAGVTTYLSFHELLSESAGFGGLGEDTNGRRAADADWGAGSTSAARTRETYPQSALVLGLDITNAKRPGGLAEIAAGRHDNKIERLATFCRETKQPIYLRLGYEFDGAWNSGYEDRATYIAAYRRIVTGLRDRGVRNVAFVWQASASPVDDVIENGKRENLRDWYPGSTYVDWVALSWFLRPEARPRRRDLRVPTQLDLAREVVALARAEHKPVMIAESTPQGYDLTALTHANISPLWDGPAGTNVQRVTAEDIWSRWYRPLFTFIAANRDTVAAFAYINARWDAQRMWAAPYANGYWGDSRVQANATLEKHWVAEIRTAPWLYGGPNLFPLLSRTPRD